MWPDDVTGGPTPGPGTVGELYARQICDLTTLSVDSDDPVALVHDYLLVLRGAERTFAAMSDLWPDAPIFTLLYDEVGTVGRFAGHQVHTSPLQHLNVGQKSFRKLLPVLGPAMRRLPLDGYGRILSSSSAFAHGIHKPPGSIHICYCHSPFRYAWHEYSRALDDVPSPLRSAVALVLRRHRAFDRRAAEYVDHFVANSEVTRRRIQRFWGQNAVVIHPPVDVERFHLGEPQDYALFVGELVSHKRPELAIEAAIEAGRPIKVVGTGPELARLRDRFGGWADFLGRVSDERLADIYAGAAALVVPNVEEFGIAAVEAQAAGRPVIAIGEGGARETVIDGRTGILVPPGSLSDLARALRGDLLRFGPEEIRSHAQRFSRQAFQARFAEVVASVSRPGGTASRGDRGPQLRERGASDRKNMR